MGLKNDVWDRHRLNESRRDGVERLSSKEL
jgi:hypothetical protein